MTTSLTVPVAAQTFEVGGKAPSPKQSGSGKTAAGGDGNFTWGSSIEVGRLARASEDANKRGNYAQAADYAQRALKLAPQNTAMWFMLGYTARLSGQYGTSIDAYKKGLAMAPNSIEGMSGLAQTYMRAGRTDEAKRLLLQVISAGPSRASDLAMAGELFINTGDTERGLAMLQRAEAQQPSSHTELLMAVAYMKSKDMARAKQLLDKAKARDPKNTDIFRVVANFQRETRDYAGAIATLRSAPHMTPDVLADLGYTYEQAGKKNESASAYAKAAAASPGNIGIQLSAAASQVHVGNVGKANEYLAKAAAIDPKHYRLHAIKADMARSDRRMADGIQEYQTALANMPEAVPEGVLYPIQLRLNLSEMYRETGDEKSAKEQIAMAEAQISKLNLEGPVRADFLRLRASIKQEDQDISGAEADLKEALAADPGNVNVVLQYANLLWRYKTKEEAIGLYKKVLEKDPNNRFALEAMGYLARDMGDPKQAEAYFRQLATAYPDDFVPYLALGDLYTTARDFPHAEDMYEKAYKLSPQNPTVIASGANAAIEAHTIPLAGQWVARAKGPLQNDTRVMRERERYLFHDGKYLESAQLGQLVVGKLPRDRDASVYLAYDLYNLGRFDDVLLLSERSEKLLPKESNFALLTGNVHVQSQLLDEAVDDYTRAIERDPRMAEAYVNRGYVLNDLQNAEAAAQDFNTALKMNPNNGTAHLGLAYSQLQTRHPQAALNSLDRAVRLIGESGSSHLARATAYRQMRVLDKAEREYRAALATNPEDLRTRMALADTLYFARKYNEAIVALNDAMALAPDDPYIYAQMAHAHAQLRHKSETFRYIEAAERESGDEQAEILIATGDALLILGDRDAAMERLSRALSSPDSNRIDARIAIAKLFARDGKFADAKQQVGLAFAEARIGESAPPTADHMIEAANIFLSMHDYDLAEKYFARARDLGAADQVVAIGMANTYLAQGKTDAAFNSLASMGNPRDFEQNFDYNMVTGEMYRQRHDNNLALAAFGRANSLSAQDDSVQRLMHETALNEGTPISPTLGMMTLVTSTPIFEDATIYMIDSKLFGTIPGTGPLPPPRSSQETRLTSLVRYHPEGMPPITASLELRNARGEISIPSESRIVQRNTYDTIISAGIDPVLRMGSNSIAINTGVQFTQRSDRISPTELDQRLIKEYLNFTTSSIGNWLITRGAGSFESGPFTVRSISSRDINGRIEFEVGRPWGKNALITGYSIRDITFSPIVREFFTTSTYGGWERKFGRDNRFRARLIGEYVRSWRIQKKLFAKGQAMMPSASFDYRVSNIWHTSGSFTWTRGEGNHIYDNMEGSFLISYVKPLRRTMVDSIGYSVVEYPMSFAFGVQAQSFTNFTGGGQSKLRPIIRLTLF